MKNKIIWVFGPSASGKETFINNIKANKQEELLARLGLENKKIIVCDESVRWISQEENDENELKRQKLAEIIKDYSNKYTDSLILVKGQDLDLENDTLNKVKKSLPDDEHEIVFLYLEFSILYQRYKAKEWWDETMTVDVCKDWARTQINFLLDHQKRGFKITALNSINNSYLNTIFPPAL